MILTRISALAAGLVGGLLAATVARSADAPAVRADSPFAFTNTTAASGLASHLAGALNHAVAWGDVDNDGRLDLFLGFFADRPGQPRGGANGLFRQRTDGTFERMAQPALERRGRTSGAAMADLDNDGDLDLYVSNNRHTQASADTAKREPSALYRNDGGTFVNVGADCGACPDDAYFGRDVGVFDYDGDGQLDLLVLEDTIFRTRAHSRLYRNRGDLKFEDATARAGLPSDLAGFGLAIADLNGDNRPDFFVAGPNRLFLSRADSGYTESASLRSVFDVHATHTEELVTGACFGDLDRDGDLDLIIGLHHVPSRAHVYLNEGLRDGAPHFRNVTAALDIPALPSKGATCAIADFNNDGWPDLYWSVWLAEGASRTPFICRGLGGDDRLPRFAVPALDGLDTRSVRKNAAPTAGRGPVYYVNGPPVDYDGDGDLDVFAGAWPEECSHLYRNDTAASGHWLTVTVRGTRMNRMGLGAKIRLLHDGRFLGYREITLNGGYSGSGPAFAHFGLGPLETADVEATLPGHPTPLLFKDVQTNRRLDIAEPP